MFINLFDSHSHSENSPDGSHSVTFMTETAVNRGLLGLAITDHCEADTFEAEGCMQRIRQSALDTAVARAAFGNSFILTFGVEVGQVFFNRAAIEYMLSKIPFDFVLGSVHRLLYNGFVFYDADYSVLSSAEIHTYLLKYFEEIVDLIKWGNFDVLAHLNFPIRYFKKNNINIDLLKYREPLDEILRLAVVSGKGIEVNASNLRLGDDMMPPAWVIKRYKELGGELVTIGSDAHSAEDIGVGITDGMNLLSGAGYEYFAFYRHRKPVMLRII